MIDPELATQIIRLALDRGATDAECTLAEGEEFSALVRMRSLERLKDAGSRVAGLRVLVGRRVGSSYTSDLSSDGIRELVKSAMELAAISTEDPHAGLPEPSELGALPGDLQLFSADIAGTNTDYRIEQARQTEEAAFSADPRITNSEGASFDAHSGKRVFANSRGFSGSYRVSSCSLSTTPVARQGEFMERDYWYSSARKYSKVPPTSAGVPRSEPFAVWARARCPPRKCR
jgi:PmbA protein